MKPAQLFALLRLLCLAVLMAGALPAHAQSTCQARAFNGHEEQVSAAYIAYYGRPADTGGLAYWAGKLAKEGGNLDAIIDAFGNSAEYRQRFGGLSNRELIRNLYQQLYGRDPDAGGWAFYEMWLDTKVLSLASIAISIMDGTEGDDVAILNNRKSVARHFITRMESLGAAAPQITDGDLLANLMAAINASAASRENACAQVNALIEAQAAAISVLAMTAHEAGASGAISNLSGAVNSERYFKLTVPAGVTNLVIRTFHAAGGMGDVDLYVSRGVRPVPGSADCSSTAWFSADEQCSFATPVAGEYFILLRGQIVDYSGVTLSASWRGSTLPPEVEVLTGYLYDSAVAGVQYRSCGGNTVAKCIEGLTGLSGEFKYTQGQQVEFLIGGLRIGVAQGQQLVTPGKLSNGDSRLALQIAQLLQSLDEDQDPSNGIVIPESVRNLAVGEYPNGQDVRFVNNSQVLGKLAPGRALVSMEQVSAHAQGASLLDVMLANGSTDIPKAILGTYAYPTTGKINFEVLNRDVHARLRLALFYRKSKQIDEILREHGDFFERMENDTQAWANRVEGAKAMGDMFAALLSMDGDRAKQAEAAISILTAAHSVVKVVDENYELNDGYLEGIKAAVLANSAIQGSDDFSRKMNVYRSLIEVVKSKASFKEDPVGKRLAEIAGMAGECVNAIGAGASGDLEAVYQCTAANLELLAKSLVEYYNAGVLLLKIPKVEAHRAARDYLAAHYYSGGDRRYMREKYGIDAFARNYDASNVIGQGYNSLLQDDIYIGAVADGMAEIERDVSVYSRTFNLQFSDFLKLKASGIENGGVVPMGTAVDFEAAFNNMSAGSYTVRSINWMASGVDSPTVVAAGTRANVRFNSAGTYRVAAHAEVLLDGQTYFMVDTFTVVVNDANVPNFTTSVTVNPIPVLEGNSVTIEIRTTPAAAFKQLQIRFWNNRFDTTDLVGWNDGVLVTDAQGIARGTYQAAKDCVAEGDGGDEVDRFSVYLQNGTRALADGDLWIQDASCTAPALTLAVTPGDGYVDLSWNAIPGATQYQVYKGVSVDGNGPGGLLSHATTAGTTLRVSGLDNGVRYGFGVTAFANGVAVAQSDVVTATPQGAGGELIAGRYLPIEGGSVIRDTVNKLEWQRCSVGQTWNGTTQRCDGTAATYTLNQAIQLTAAGGFRIPTSVELKTLVYCSSGQPQLFGPLDDDVSCSGNYSRPTVAQAAFPNTRSSPVWSGSPYAWYSGGPIGAWLVDFGDGEASGNDNRNANYPVRLVRGGQSFTPLTARSSSLASVNVASLPAPASPAALGSAPATFTGYDGTPPNAAMHGVRPDATGRGAYFLSRATNLVPGVSNGAHHLFHFDASTGQIKNLGASTSGTPGDGDITAFDVALQAGKLVFRTKATNLESGPGLYLLDLETGTRRPLLTALQHGGSDPGAENPVLGTSARALAFDAPDAQGQRQVFTAGLDASGLYDLRQETPLDAAVATACCVALSADGRYLAWQETGHDGRMQARVLELATDATATLDWPQGDAAQALRLALSADGAQLHWLAAPVAAEDAAPLHGADNPLFVPTQRLH